jgi:hypothetical protein
MSDVYEGFIISIQESSIMSRFYTLIVVMLCLFTVVTPKFQPNRKKIVRCFANEQLIDDKCVPREQSNIQSTDLSAFILKEYRKCPFGQVLVKYSSVLVKCIPSVKFNVSKYI